MCGIAGRAGPHTSWVPDQALTALTHRGPDAAGVEEMQSGDWFCTIAHTRLAINDLTGRGDQPLYNEDEVLALVFNGEIYNSPDLRRHCEANGHTFRSDSDAEVVLHLWEDEGPAALERLNGIFAFALHDRRDGSLVLVRDPLGVKPLFWSADREFLWFASELRALKAAGAPLGSADVVALAQFLTFLWIPDPRTPYSEARSLLPGTMLTWRAGVHRVQKYADLIGDSADAPTLTLEVAEREFRGRFEEAVRRQLLSDVPVAIMASGGIDSSLLWWAAKDQLATAYTIDWSAELGEERLYEDTQTVRLLAASLGTPVCYIPGAIVDIEAMPRSGDLFADPAVELCRQIAERANADGNKVLLSGQGGDELLGGYRRHLLGPGAARLHAGVIGRWTSALLAKSSLDSLNAEYASRLALSASKGHVLASYMVLCSYSDATDRAAALDVSATEVADEVVWEAHSAAFERSPSSWSLLRRFRALDMAVYLPGLGLAYADRSGMQHSVEIRVPWLDLDLVRWALQLPDQALVRRTTGKVLARKLASETLPRGVSSRPKRGFAAPIRLLPQGSPGSRRNFRQARYLAAACSVIDRWMAIA